MDEPADALYTAIASRLGAFVESRVVTRLHQAFGEVTPDQLLAASQAGRRAEEIVLPRLAALLDADVDRQASTPLALVRSAITFATPVLDRFGVPPATRDRFQIEHFPDDRYGLVPASLDALGEEVGELGIVWGAAKAMAHRRRHGPRPDAPHG